MSFSFKQFQGPAGELEVELTTDITNERERDVVSEVGEALQKIVGALGDSHVSVSASGHIGPSEVEPGDTVSIYVTTLAVPGGDTVASSTPEPTPVDETVSTADALAATQGDQSPTGDVAPAAGDPAPMSAGGTPGLTAAAPETPAEAPVVEEPIAPVEQPAEGDAPPAADAPPVETPEAQTEIASDQPPADASAGEPSW